RNLSCAIYQIHTVKDPYCHLKKNYESERTVFQFLSCKCDIREATLKSEQCDAGINSESILASENWVRSPCFFTSITGHHPLFIGERITLSGKSREETEEMPICAMALLIGNSGLFYRFYNVRYSQFQDEIPLRKRFSVTKQGNYTTYTTLCRANGSYPCNSTFTGFDNSSTKLFGTFGFQKKKPRFYHQCVVSEKAKTTVTKCFSTAGCFFFSYLYSQETLVSKAEALGIV
ncbi:hypothetical protein LOAG_05222, partial [Loa loa]